MAYIKCSVNIIFLSSHKEIPIVGSLPYGFLLEYLKEDAGSNDGSCVAEKSQ